MSWPVISQQIMATDTLWVIAPVNEAAPTNGNSSAGILGGLKMSDVGREGDRPAGLIPIG